MGNEFFYYLDFLIKGLEFLALIVILLISYQKISVLLWGGGNNIHTKDDASLHSCFISVLTVAVFHFIGSSLAQYTLSLDLEKMALRQVYYFMMFIIEFIFISSLFVLHKIRNCPFSPAARYCMYFSTILCIVQMIEFISRGVLDSNTFTLSYRTFVVLINLATLYVVSYYPLKYLKNNNVFKKQPRNEQWKKNSI